MEGDEVLTVALQPSVPVRNTVFMELLVTITDTDLGELLFGMKLELNIVFVV